MKKTFNIETAKEIVSFFECPDECNGLCCKKGSVEFFTKKEFIKFKRLNENNNFEKIKINNTTVPMYQMNLPCVFLTDDGKCKEHDNPNLPTICKMFPFLPNDNPNLISMSLYLCPLGMEIYNILLKLRMKKAFENNIPVEHTNIIVKEYYLKKAQAEEHKKTHWKPTTNINPDHLNDLLHMIKEVKIGELND